MRSKLERREERMAGVFDFDEDDIEPFPSKRNRTHVSTRAFKDAEHKSCSTAGRKLQGKTINGKKIDTKSSFQSLESVLKALRCNLSQGSTMEERLSEVTVGGESLLFAKGTIQMHSLEFTFSTASIALKMLDDNQNVIAITWLLDEITGFSFRTCQQTSDKILELILTESGMKLLEHKLGSLLCKCECSCDKGYTLATKIKIPYQSDLERRITSLCDRYKVLWRPWQIKSHGQPSLKQDMQEWKGSEKHKLFVKGEPNEQVISEGLKVNMTSWFDLTYPKGDPDAVLITMDDFFLLNPHEFVSDTIIDFYIKYLQSRLPEHEKKRLYFFNSFFFRKLANLGRDIAYETSSLFEHMKRWTRDINIFKKDFLFIPIMQSAHWSLVIVCYPGQLFNEPLKLCKETLILHFDSMEGFHKGVEETIEKYLVQHWSRTFSTGISRNDKSCNVKCIRAKVPQQRNYSDCGLFMLHYVEMFLTALQSGLSSIQVSRNWFNPEDVASKRSVIQSLIKEIQLEELAEKVVRKHADTPVEEPLRGTIFMEDVSVVQKVDLSEEKIFKTDVGSTQKADSSHHSGLLQTVDNDCHEAVCCLLAATVCGNQLAKASDACQPGATIKTFDEEKFREPSATPYMEHMHPTYLSTGKDGRHMVNICGDFDISRNELNKMSEEDQYEGFTTNAKQSENNELDDFLFFIHTLHTKDEKDNESYHHLYCDQGATQGTKLKCLPFKDQQSLLQASNHEVSRDLDSEDHYTVAGLSRKATHLKGNFVNKMDHTPDEEQGHSARASIHHAHDPTCQSHQVYISSDEESGYVKVQTMFEAVKLRQQNRQRKAEKSKGEATPIVSNASKGIENQPPNARWRLRRKSQLPFL